MEKFYCNECEEDVKLVDGKCPKCGTNWEKIITESVLDEYEASNYIDSFGKSKSKNGNNKNKDIKNKDVEEKDYEDEDTDEDDYEDEDIDDDYESEYIEEDDIEETYNFFLKYASIGKIFCFILAGIIAFIAIVESSNLESTLIFVLSIPIVAVIIFYGMIFEKNLKWKAYMLKTNYKNIDK